MTCALGARYAFVLIFTVDSRSGTCRVRARNLARSVFLAHHANIEILRAQAVNEHAYTFGDARSNRFFGVMLAGMV